METMQEVRMPGGTEDKALNRRVSTTQVVARHKANLRYRKGIKAEEFTRVILPVETVECQTK